MKNRMDFLPTTAADVAARGWSEVDFVYVSGDAYVDHPSFGVAIISRVLEAAGFRVAILSQPDYKSAEAFRRFGRPRLGFLVTSGNIDSMVAHYTVSKKRRSYDYYSAGGKMGARPDRAVIVYSNRIREAYGDVPIIIGGLEASLRRFAHYDYWDDRVRRSILVDSRADILTYGMGENIILRIARLLDKGVPIKKIRDVRGTVYLTKAGEAVHFDSLEIGDYNTLKEDKAAYARAFALQYKNTDSVRGKALIEYYDGKMLVQNPPMPPLEREELDRVYALPYARDYHPDYAEAGGVPAISEVKFSITHNRGCFGACNFCAIAFHQGREVRSRSAESVVSEARLISEMPDFKGYINDVGGPTANFRHPSCDRQREAGVCPSRKCLAPVPCKHLKVDHTEYSAMLAEIEKIDKIKKVFIRSGIRFDYLMADPDDSFFRRLVSRHVSGQLKVAPEHCSNNALMMMGKPPIEVYEKFSKKYFEITNEVGLEQYLVPYLMSSHPGTTMNDAVNMALWLKRHKYSPEQVQDFYPTPGTISTVMYYTGIDPMTNKRVYVCTDYHEKQLQRALLQYARPENANLVREALRAAGREDLIGTGAECLVRPAFAQGGRTRVTPRASGAKAGVRTGVTRGKTPPRTPAQAGSSRTQGTGSRTQGTGSRTQGTNAHTQGGNSRNQATGSNNQGTNARTQGGNSRNQGGNSRNQATGSRNQGTNARTQGAGSRTQGTGSRTQGGKAPRGAYTGGSGKNHNSSATVTKKRGAGGADGKGSVRNSSSKKR